ncbi:hypothetical protein HYO99_gp17 [Roseobacter phage RD-1410W1-01]|uniref:Uncharacterized protein n=1 Tax=Roseobacter phage RD-1410W1-01 TaxID=1815984 RepID=A0A191VYG4_9CAUD|nr:hypothetical protein HYO99_gp17 [Roseobacter phage RD-1410W1-01]ANJ20751.1 hypothetical protein RDp01_gp17 [Roseobacter phage RD-1410W1-01]
MIVECLNTEQMGYFLSLLDPDVWKQTAQGLVIGTQETLWTWNKTTQLWCWK